MRCWLHRISHHAETSWPLLERGILTVGFSDFGYPEFLGKDWHDFEEVIQDAWGFLDKRRYNLWRFLHDMEKDDLVLVPGWRTYSVYVIKGDPKPIGNLGVSDLRTWNDEIVKKYEYDVGKMYALRVGERHIDLGFFRSTTVVIPYYGCGAVDNDNAGRSIDGVVATGSIQTRARRRAIPAAPDATANAVSHPHSEPARCLTRR